MNVRADLGGAIFAEQHSIINMSGNVFVNNNATYGGVLHSFSIPITIKGSEFYDNSAIYGGVLESTTSITTIIVSEFHNNNMQHVQNLTKLVCSKPIKTLSAINKLQIGVDIQVLSHLEESNIRLQQLAGFELNSCHDYNFYTWSSQLVPEYINNWAD